MKTYCLSFTDKGEQLAERLSEEFGAYADRCNKPLNLQKWTEKAFAEADTIVFVGACGIAVRAIAPHVVSKVTDPAVIVIDECGEFVISLLSGHLGGANDMARRIAAFLGSVPVITTATDRNDVFAVDEWSKRQNAIVLEPPKIKLVSSKILDGKDVMVRSGFDVKGELPEHLALTGQNPDGASLAGGEPAEDADIEFDVFETSVKPLHIVPVIVHLGIGCRKDTPEVAIEQAFAAFKRETGLIERSVVKCASIDLKAGEPGLREFCEFHGWKFETSVKPLHIVPVIVHLGIGCRKDTPEVAIEQAFAAFKRETGLIERSVVKCASIDLKAGEPGLREFCEFHGWKFETFSAEELEAAEGEFESSEFVKKTTGVDNVCERAAVVSSGGKLIAGKFAHEGVTFAAAAEPYFPDWRWKDE